MMPWKVSEPLQYRQGIAQNGFAVQYSLRSTHSVTSHKLRFFATAASRSHPAKRNSAPDLQYLKTPQLLQPKPDIFFLHLFLSFLPWLKYVTMVPTGYP